MSDELQALMDKLKASRLVKRKMLFFRASQEMLDVLDHIQQGKGDQHETEN